MAEEKKVSVKVLRAFRVKGERKEPGKVITVDAELAAEMVSAEKAEYAKGKAADKE